MDSTQTIAVIVAVAALALITFEERLTTQKTPIALIAGVGLWLLAAANHDGDTTHLLIDANAEIFEIFAFLFAAMVLVENLDRLGFFELVRTWLLRLGLRDRKQFIFIGGMAFVLSAVLDNLTATIVMVEFSRRFFRGRNLLVAAAGIVVFANAGGAWSPIGDVTTIMLWVQQKFTSQEIVAQVLVPSIVHAAVAGALLYRQIGVQDAPDDGDDLPVRFTGTDKFLMILTLACFSLPLVVRQVFGVSPYLGLLLGLGIVWATMDHLRRRAGLTETREDERPQTRLQHDIIALMREVDYRSLLFFVGILLMVSALGELGVLAEFSDWLLGEDPSGSRLILGAVVLGYGSALVDNVPLTALAIDILATTNAWYWTLLAYTVGTGGSHLVLGSVAGVIAMGKVEGLTSVTYVRIAFVAVFWAYLAGFAVWLLQYSLFA